jgi:tetraspanin-11
MFSSIKLYGTRRQVTQAWDTTQTRLKCCGVDSFRNWQGKLPFSCCQEIDRDGIQRKPCQDNPSLANVYGRGCLEVGLEFVRDRANVIGLSGIIVAVLMIFGMIFSCTFFNMIE